MAFSVPMGMRIPPSLRNIFVELMNDIPDFRRNENCGNLQKWTTEGVLLLNSFLTVERFEIFIGGFKREKLFY